VSTNRHHDKQLTQNQNNLMSDDPGDGNRNSERLGPDGDDKGVAGAPEEKAQKEKETLEALGEEGAGVASKE